MLTMFRLRLQLLLCRCRVRSILQMARLGSKAVGWLSWIENRQLCFEAFELTLPDRVLICSCLFLFSRPWRT